MGHYTKCFGGIGLNFINTTIGAPAHQWAR